MSPPFEVEFTWYRDREGRFDLKEPRVFGPKKHTDLVALLNDEPLPLPLRVVRRPGVRLEPYDLVDRHPALYRELAKLHDAREVLLFVKKHGPVTQRGLKEDGYDDVELVLSHAAGMRSFLRAKEEDDDEFILKVCATERFGQVDFKPSFDRVTGKPTLVFVPQSFLGAMWLQLGQALRGPGAVFRRCEHCGETFEAGPGTGRRLDAKYCCDAHRTVFNSLKRSRRPDVASAKE
jgi:hypothetical protein